MPNSQGVCFSTRCVVPINSKVPPVVHHATYAWYVMVSYCLALPLSLSLQRASPLNYDFYWYVTCCHHRMIMPILLEIMQTALWNSCCKTRWEEIKLSVSFEIKHVHGVHIDCLTRKFVTWFLESLNHKINTSRAYILVDLSDRSVSPYLRVILERTSSLECQEQELYQEPPSSCSNGM